MSIHGPYRAQSSYERAWSKTYTRASLPEHAHVLQKVWAGGDSPAYASSMSIQRNARCIATPTQWLLSATISMSYKPSIKN
jgi:hypothetical protein